MIDPADIQSTPILIVDDCSDTASTLCVLLKWKGYKHVSWTTDSKAVPGLVTANPCSLILLDMHMPDPSGLEVIRNLHAIEAAHRVRVVAISGDQRYSTVSIAAGAAAFLIKPFSHEELKKTICAALSSDLLPLARQTVDV
jgi:DNA-binding response OmpR family regulator